jgi:hypothetical protein
VVGIQLTISFGDVWRSGVGGRSAECVPMA